MGRAGRLDLVTDPDLAAVEESAEITSAVAAEATARSAADAGKQPLAAYLTTLASVGSHGALKTALGLVKADVGLGNVDNTSDASKPVSTATQTALNLKANDADVVKLAGAQTVAGVKTFSSAPVIPAEVYGSGWNGKQEPAPKDALYDKIELLVADIAAGGGGSGGTTWLIATGTGIDPTGVSDSTAGLQAVIDQAVTQNKSVFVPAGTYLTGPLDLNGTGHATPADSQYVGVMGFRGASRASTVFKAKTGSYTTQAVLTMHNTANCEIGHFTVDGNSGVADIGCDFSWIGGSSGDPALAPSNRNIIENIRVLGCTDLSINLDQQHDAVIQGLIVEGSTDVGISLIGAGGMVAMSDCVVSTGTFDLACQNAVLTNCGFFGGMLLTGGGYNHVAMHGGQIYPHATSDISIDATGASGNACRGMTFHGVLFPPTVTVFSGRLHEGIEFVGCGFVDYTDIFDAITPASGSGQLPVLEFERCSFADALPATVASEAFVVVRNCRKSDGTMANSDPTTGLLAKQVHTAGSPSAVAATSTSYADVDATNQAVTFVFPPSGAVAVYVYARFTVAAGNVHAVNLRDGSGDIAGTKQNTITGTGGDHSARTVVRMDLTGTPGTSKTVKLGHARPSGAGTAQVDRTAEDSVVMEVWAA